MNLRKPLIKQNIKRQNEQKRKQKRKLKKKDESIKKKWIDYMILLERKNKF